MWDPGHSCVKGNIIPNDLVGLGFQTAPVGFEPIVEICETLIRRKLREWTVGAHIGKRGKAGGSMQSKTFMNIANSKDEGEGILCLNRKGAKILLSCFIGYRNPSILTV